MKLKLKVKQGIYNIDGFRSAAKRKLPAMVFDFLDGGTLDEKTLHRNRSAFDGILLEQRVLVDVGVIDTSTHVLGTRVELPLIVSPMGMLTGFHPASDLAVAKAAARAGSIFIHSAWSACSLEEVSDASPDKVWAQVNFWRDALEVRKHVDRARDLGIDTLVIAADVNVAAKRERDLRHGTRMPPEPPLSDVVNTALHPVWLWRLATGRPITYGNYQLSGRPIRMSEMDPWVKRNANTEASWKDFADLRRLWSGQLVVKGVMSPKDAEIAIDHGADGVFISNHGGRQFDSSSATVEALPRVADAVNGRIPIIVDGGIRRGSDIAKVIALGATSAAAGRPFAYALANGGSSLDRAFEILRDEFETTMGFLGATKVSELNESVLLNGVGSPMPQN